VSRTALWPGIAHATAALLLALMAWMADSSAAHKSPTFDETAGLVSGFTWWQTGDARLDPENGLLAKRLAALPLWLAEPEPLDLSGRSWELGFDWGLARELLYAEGRDAEAMMRGARRVIVVLAVSLGALVYAWSARLYGPAGGLLSLWLTIFCPNLLAHGRLVTSDLAMSLLLPACVGATWWTFRRVTPGRLLACALSTGLLFLAKFAALGVLPMLALLVALRVASPEPLRTEIGRPREWSGRGARVAVLLGVLTFTGLVSVAMIWAAYGFAFHPTSGTPFAFNWPRIESLSGPLPALILWLRDVSLLPEPWLYGLGYTVDSIQSRVAFANGEISTTGWWWFFPYAVAIKTPVGSLAIWAIAAIGAIAVALRGIDKDALWRLTDRTAPLFVLLVVYGISSLTSNINIGVRHVLPIYPVAMILAGSVTRLPLGRAGQALLLALMLATAAESWSVRPHYLAFFNRLAGGPEQGYQRLVDSNLDWGQDLPALAARLAEEPATACWLSYFGSASPTGHGVTCTRLPGFFDFDRARVPTTLGPGLYAVSATLLQGLHLGLDFRGTWTDEREARLAEVRLQLAREERRAGPRQAAEREWTQNRELFERLRFARLLAWLRERKPDETLGHSILLYRLRGEELQAALEGPLGSRESSDAGS
jgi:hypothetical protein